MTAHTIAKIAKLESLKVLDLSDCELSENSLVPIGSSPTLRGVLRKLYVNYNKFGLKDTSALALLTALEVLKLRCCKLLPDSLVPIGNSPTLRRVLRELYADYNELGLKDALAFLAVLKVLKLRYCKLPSGFLPPLYGSLIRPGVLHELDVAGNQDLSPGDRRIITASRQFVNVAS